MHGQSISANALLCPQGDISAETMINNVTGVDPARRERLMQVLDVNPAWRMNRVSDGQRRRVQLAMGLLKPFNVRAHHGSVLTCGSSCHGLARHTCQRRVPLYI